MPTTSSRRRGRSASRRNSRTAVGTVATEHAAPESNNKASSVLQHIRELFRVSQQHFQRIEARCGVSGTLLWAMAELRARPGLKVSELATALSVHLSTASNLLDRLEAKTLIRRERGIRDQRIVRIYLTPLGRRILGAAPKPAEGVIPDALYRMPTAALARLDRDLEKLLQLASVRNRKAAMKPLAEP
jgi:DNA-binding MarR family transcriptional regulator